MLYSNIRLCQLLFVFIMVCFQYQPAHSQVAESSELFKDLVNTDSLLFEEGFNQCNVSIVEEIIHEDLEFFHDVSGTENRKEFLNGFRRNICSTPDYKPIRKLVPNSLEVYALKNNGKIYGAIQKGEHRFFIKETGKEMYYTTSAKFTNVWVRNKNYWKLKTSLSYDHGKEPSYQKE